MEIKKYVQNSDYKMYVYIKRNIESSLTEYLYCGFCSHCSSLIARVSDCVQRRKQIIRVAIIETLQIKILPTTLKCPRSIAKHRTMIIITHFRIGIVGQVLSRILGLGEEAV